MKVNDIMTKNVIDIGMDETVSVAARTLTNYNIGMLPVRGKNGEVCGVLTDRDIVIRCLAAGRTPENTQVQDIMTAQVHSVRPDMDVSLAAHLMGRQQIRRLPVMENGKVCGMLSLGDIALCEDCAYDATDALSDIADSVSRR